MGMSSVEGQSGPLTKRPPPREIPSLTSLRGFLAVWVVTYHFWNDVLRLFPLAELLSPIVQLGHMAVPAFFMLSGFVLSFNYADRFSILRRNEVVRFLCLRLARIYPVHLVTLLAVAAMVQVSNRAGYQLTDAGYSTQDFVLNLLLVHTWVPDFRLNWNYPSWSISSEWFAYLLFPFAVTGGLRQLTTPFRAIAFGVATLAGSIAVMVCWQPWPFYELVLVVPTFFTGAAIYWIVRKRCVSPTVSSSRWLPELLVLALGAFCFMLPVGLMIAALLCGFFFLILTLLQFGGSSLVWNSRPAIILGEVSYSLYMTHTLAQKVLYRLLPSARFETADTPTKLCVLIGYVGLVLIFCFASFFLIESPCRRFFKKAVASSP